MWVGFRFRAAFGLWVGLSGIILGLDFGWWRIVVFWGLLLHVLLTAV